MGISLLKRVDCLETVSDAIKMVNSVSDSSNPLYKIVDQTRHGHAQRLFGMWFRGQSSIKNELNPSIFRAKKDGSAKFGERSIFYDFVLRNSSLDISKTKGCFDWLSIMQHYSTPTRLLDWSESILVALYFATCNRSKHDEDGVLYVINSHRLNYATTLGKFYGLCTPNSLDVVLRSSLCVSESISVIVEKIRRPSVKENLIDSFQQQEMIAEKIGKKDAEMIDRISMPVAVFPSRDNPRLIAQSGAFTIHGGKLYNEKHGPVPADRLPAPVSIDNIPGSEKFLSKIIIRKENKLKMLDELCSLKVDSSVLFPELEYQAEYLKRMWGDDS